MAVYKDHLFAARCRLEQLNGRSQTPSPVLPRDLVATYSHRKARTWAGATGAVGACVLAVTVINGGAHASSVLLATWAAMGWAYLTSLLTSGAWLRRAVRQPDTPTDPLTELERLESKVQLRAALARTHRAEVLSTALPLVVLSLLCPLTLHMGFSFAFLQVDVDEFNRWIVGSYALVGHAHLTLLVFSVRHVLRVRRELDHGQPPVGTSRGFKALVWSTVAGAIPGIVLLCIPPALVFLTGVAFVPWMFAWAAKRIRTERQVLASHGYAYPSNLPWRARPPR
jgi:hypothetical protein